MTFVDSHAEEIINKKYFFAVKRKRFHDIVTEMGVQKPVPTVSVSSSPCI